jgi:hypothetical protein
MTQAQIDGMKARAAAQPRESCRLTGAAKDEWMKGYGILDDRINDTIKNSVNMLDQMQSLRRQTPHMRMVAG